MPPLSRPESPALVTLPPRVGTVAGRADVLVVGGGPAGLGAALGAADAGADVILVERYGFLGGNATVSLVMPLMSFHTQRGAPRPPAGDDLPLMPTDHGPGDPVVAGALRKLLERLIAGGGAVEPSERTGYTVPFDPEEYKLAMLDLLDEAGVRFLFHAFASGVVGGDQVEGVVFETKSGPLVIQTGVVVDCTGDGDVAAAAGAPFDVGREDGLVQPMTLMFRMVEFDRPGFAAYVRDNPSQWRGVHGLWELIAKASRDGRLELPREDMLFFGTPHEREVSVNSTRVPGLGIDVWDLTAAEAQSRRQMRQIAAFLREYVPGFEEAYVAQSGVNIGVRETRRIRGEYQLTSDDVLQARKFPDAIARGSYPVDIHNPQGGKGTVLQTLPPGEAYDIPLRCLLPQEVDRVLVAGRCISGTHEAHSSYRVTPIAMATGQAAGICAALAARTGRSPRQVDASEVQQVLLGQGANLGDRASSLSRASRPSP